MRGCPQVARPDMRPVSSPRAAMRDPSAHVLVSGTERRMGGFAVHGASAAGAYQAVARFARG